MSGHGLADILMHIAHGLPAQAPITDFIHHNTLHADQHLGFKAAVARAERRSQARGYPSAAFLRAAWAEGRIQRADLDQVLALHPALEATKTILPGISWADIYALLLSVPFDPLPIGRLRWLLEQGRVDLPLWEGVLSVLALPAPEGEPPLEGRGSALERGAAEGWARSEVVTAFEGMGTLVDLVGRLSGVDINRRINEALIPQVAAAVDEGLSPWPRPDPRGLYVRWRQERGDPDLSADPVQAIEALLHRLNIPALQWAHYLERTAWRLPGWGGMSAWREAHPDWPGQQRHPIHFAELLAVRLYMEQDLLQQICMHSWQVAATPEALLGYFKAHPEEFVVRRQLYMGLLPEALADRARAAATEHHPEEDPEWREIAVDCWRWHHSALGERPGLPAAQREGWMLWSLCHYQKVSLEQLRSWPLSDIRRMLRQLEIRRPEILGPIGLEVYESHYRQQVLDALAAGTALPLAQRPAAQVVVCMDDREEAFRRSIEVIAPQIETFGAAGFFGVPMRYLGLGADREDSLCPPVLQAVYRVQEEIVSEPLAWEKGYQRWRWLSDAWRHIARRNWLMTLVAPVSAVPIALAATLRVMAPLWAARLKTYLRQQIVPEPQTRLNLQSIPLDARVMRVRGLLRNMGLTQQFAPFVVLLGHGSGSLNNPHLSAYDCGACGGRHGGPNARAFAAMANDPNVRAQLAKEGIDIPSDCVFIGGEHQTASEGITLYDLDMIPPLPSFLMETLHQAAIASAHERCRRLASAPRHQSPGEALRHVATRGEDPSQARPELGHVTNATAIIGRRSLSQGLFLDRRAFLVSYDPLQDQEGQILEGILGAVGPVGAGISLEYYFSTVDPERFGCGTKVPHNLSALVGVMEGTRGDLRTGLPRQMIEIHEPMRLLLVVESTPEILTAICGRHAGVAELVEGGWVQLAAIDPQDRRRQFLYQPHIGFHPRPIVSDIPVVPQSQYWYEGPEGALDKPLPPCRIEAMHA